MRRVLIVDDSVSMRQMIGYTLRQGGYEVIEAEHGGDALKKLACVTVDLIITDLNMPMMGRHHSSSERAQAAGPEKQAHLDADD